MRRKGKIVICACAVISVVIALLITSVVCLVQKEEEPFDYATFYAEKLLRYAQENERYADYEVDVAFLGDSLTDACDLDKYYPQYVTSNRGIGGDTTITLEQRLEVSVYDLKPKVIVLLIGGNNFDTMLDNYERIVESIQENLPKTELIIVSLTAMGGDDWGKNNEIARQNNVEVKRIAEAHDCAYVDLYTPLMNPDTGEIFEEYTIDGAHQTDAGYRVFQAHITPAIKTALENWNAD